MSIDIPAWLLITLASMMLITVVCQLIATIMDHILKKYYANLDLWYSLKGGDQIYHTELGPGTVDICYRESQEAKGERLIIVIFGDEPIRLLFDFHSNKIIKRKG